MKKWAKILLVIGIIWAILSVYLAFDTCKMITAQIGCGPTPDDCSPQPNRCNPGPIPYLFLFIAIPSWIMFIVIAIWGISKK